MHGAPAGGQKATGQQQLPDRTHAPLFWSQVASTFKDNPLVMFELFNEPFLGESQAKAKDWACWANATQCSGIGYQPVSATMHSSPPLCKLSTRAIGGALADPPVLWGR